jgi:hypothetical protein
MANKRYLEGSAAKDAFLYWHKQRLPKNFYGIDADLCLIRRAPFDLIAVTDFKAKGKRDGIGFSHIVLYNWFLARGIPVYIIYALWNERRGNNADFTDIDIDMYLWGDPKPDNTPHEKRRIITGGSQGDYIKWEADLRANYQTEDKKCDVSLEKTLQFSLHLQRHMIENAENAKIDWSYLSGGIGQIILNLLSIKENL